MHLLTTEVSTSLSEDSRVCSVPVVLSSWSLGAASLVLLLPVSALAWRWRFFRLSFRVWMMSFTFPHGVLCAFWWGSFPVPVLATTSYIIHHILHRHAYRRAKAVSDITHYVLCNWPFHNSNNKKIFISFSSLSCERSKASSRASSPHSAIQSFLFQMRVSSPFLKVIQ